jgi:hypothetical protein
MSIEGYAIEIFNYQNKRIVDILQLVLHMVKQAVEKHIQ